MKFKIPWAPGRVIEGYIWKELTNMIIIQSDSLYAVKKSDLQDLTEDSQC